MVCPGKACVLVAHETTDANMRLLLGKTVYGLTGSVIHQLGLRGPSNKSLASRCLGLFSSKARQGNHRNMYT